MKHKPLLSLGLVSVMTLATWRSLEAQEGPRNFIATQGQCIRDLPADRISVSFVSRAENANLKKAQESSRERYEKLRVKLKAMNLKDSKIETSIYDVQENRVWEKDRRVFKGFVVQMGLRLETSEIDRVGEALAAATDIGITNTDGLQMFLSREKQDQVRLECLEIASKDAQRKAQKIAESLGVKLGAAQSVTESGGFSERPMHRNFVGRQMMAMEASSAAPQVEAQSEQFNLSLQVSFGIR
jgi:uncharacterized protein YggE